MSAIASVVTDDDMDEISVFGVKPGDGVITLRFYSDERDYDQGMITIYSNGFMDFSCEDLENKKELYELFCKIHGNDAPKLTDDDLYMPLVSNGLDPERFKRAKDFVRNAGVELQYSEDILMNNEEEYKKTR